MRQNVKLERREPKCTFEEVSASDVLDAAESVQRGRGGDQIITTPPGVGVDALLGWALTEIASASQDGAERIRLASNAVINARRALECLTDWYLTSFGFSFCKGALRAQDKSELLQRRGVVDDLTARVVGRTIDMRNDIEHRYVAPSIEDAENAVELTRRTIHFIKRENDPSTAPWLFGGFSHGRFISPQETRVEFDQWNGVVFIIATFFTPPWLGVVEPSSKTQAHVRRAYFRDVDLSIYEEILRVLEGKIGRLSSAASASICRDIAIGAGLNG
jgi:phage FluMu protein gp41